MTVPAKGEILPLIQNRGKEAASKGVVEIPYCCYSVTAEGKVIRISKNMYGQLKAGRINCFYFLLYSTLT